MPDNLEGDVGSSVPANENLARYIFCRDHVRADATIKPDAFVPFKWVELSVTRHLQLSEERIWELGDGVGAERRLPLLGRADCLAKSYLDENLSVVADPVPGNLNHANVCGWPSV